MMLADSGVLRGRRFGNLVLAASRATLPLDAIGRAAASAAFRRSVLTAFGRGARPLTDADPMRSPAPPDETWRVVDWQDDVDCQDGVDCRDG